MSSKSNSSSSSVEKDANMPSSGDEHLSDGENPCNLSWGMIVDEDSENHIFQWSTDEDKKVPEG